MKDREYPITVTFKMDMETYDKLKDASTEKDRTVSYLIREAIKEKYN